MIIPSRREAFTSGQTVFSIPQKSSTASTPVYNTSLALLRDYALLSNGSDDIYLLETGDRFSEVIPHWKVRDFVLNLFT